MSDKTPLFGIRTCWATAAGFILGLLALVVRLKAVQIDAVADSMGAAEKQSVRLVQTDGVRGRILDRHGVVLAGNRPSVSIALNAAQFKMRTQHATATNILAAIERVATNLNLTVSQTEETIKRHLQRNLARPLIVWRDIDDLTLARFSEHQIDCPGFICLESEERVYPKGPLAAHLLGYVGRDRTQGTAGDAVFQYHDLEMRGRAGIEHYYDGFLRGMPGEVKVRVDARGFVHDEVVAVKSRRGPDLRLALDANIQAVVEEQIKGEKGACVVMDPRTGDVLAFASAPGYDPNDLVPVFPKAVYDRLTKDPDKPLLNRASGGSYAPGSTFKPITALAALANGVSPTAPYECFGYYMCGKMKIRCVRTWGHGEMNVRSALRDSCNSYFCHFGMTTGTNNVFAAARAFGLGAKTGIDFGVDVAGLVPDATWKMDHYHERWYPGDLAQMSIGQGMLLASPLQMARVVGALATGYLVKPHLKQGLPVERTWVPYKSAQMRAVREGMRAVVTSGTGRRAGEGGNAWVIGKTGTAELGRGATRRKNTWFIGYAETCARDAEGEIIRRTDPETAVAIAMIIENGESGGGTTAPKAGAVLRHIFPAEGGADAR